MKSLVFAVVAALPAVLGAQRADTLTVLLPAVSVTATRTSLSTRALPVSVSVFNRAALRDAGITQVADVMRLVPGATVLSNGSYGSQTSLFLRGGESDYVQVLVDGIPMNAPGGAFDFGQLTIDNIDRVEVVRGPASVLYGSDAVSGVIQIFTRTGARIGNQFSAVAGGGTYGTRHFEMGYVGNTGQLGWSFDGARHRTNGILPFNNAYQNDVASAAMRWTGRRVNWSGTVRFTDYSFHYPTNSAGALSDSNAYTTERRLVGGFDIGLKAASWFEVRGRIAHDRAQPKTRDLPDDSTDHNLYKSDATVTRDVFEERAIVTMGRSHVLTLAAEHARDRDDETSQSESDFGSFPGSLKATRTNDGLSAQLIGNAGARATYTFGVRRDDNSEFGRFKTTRAAAAYRVSHGTSIRGSLGTAFKAPTFFENFATGFTVGNPGLTPERARTYELGLQHASPTERVTYGVTAFWQRFRDLIQYVAVVAPGAPNYRNLAAASADGVEFEAAVRLGGRTSLRGSYTRLNTEVTDAGADSGTSASFVKGDRLLRRPTHLATLGWHQTWRGNAIDVTGTYTGARDDRDFSQFPALPVVLKAFTRVDLAIVSPLKSMGHLEHPSTVLRVENLFNKGYEQTLGFRSPGRSIFFGFRVGE